MKKEQEINYSKDHHILEPFILDTLMIEELKPALPQSEYDRINGLKTSKKKKTIFDKLAEPKKKIKLTDIAEKLVKPDNKFEGKRYISVGKKTFKQLKQEIEKRLIKQFGKIPKSVSFVDRSSSKKSNILVHLKGLSVQTNFDTKNQFSFSKLVKQIYDNKLDK